MVIDKLLHIWENFFMKLIGRKKLFAIYSGPNASMRVRQWVCAWFSEVQGANWKSPDDVKSHYPNVKYVNGVFVFHIKNSDIQIHLCINFFSGIAVITNVEEQL